MFYSPWHFVEFFLLLQEDYNHFKVRILQYLMLRHFKFEFAPFAVEKVLGKKNNRSSASFNSLKYAIPNVATDSKIHKSLPLVMYLLHNVTSNVAVYLSIFWERKRFKDRMERIQTPAWWNGFNQSHCIQFLTIKTWGLLFIFTAVRTVGKIFDSVAPTSQVVKLFHMLSLNIHVLEVPVVNAQFEHLLVVLQKPKQWDGESFILQVSIRTE